MKHRQSIFTPTFFAVCIFALTFILLGNRMVGYEGMENTDEVTATATVLEILEERVEPSQGEFTTTIITYTAKLTSGDQKGETVDGVQHIDDMFLPVPESVKEGDSILLMAPQGTDHLWVYADHNSVPMMGVLVALFFLSILIIGRGKGIATILSLLFTMGAIFYVYIPSILAGHNVYSRTITVSIFIILSSLILLNGWNLKTLCAIVGNVGGTLLAGVLAIIFNRIMGITGIVDQDYLFLTMLTGDVSIDLQAVVWGGILIGSLGAVMDVAMSIASAMNELSEEMEEKSFRRLAAAGMRIGQDAIGTMTNTLILAYLGGSMAVVLLFAAYNKNMMIVLNLEMISIEVIQAVVGSMGILLAVPLTVCFSAWVYVKQGGRRMEKTKIEEDVSHEVREL